METMDRIRQGIVAGEFKEIKGWVQKALEEGAKPEAILNQGLFAGMDVVGQRFRDEDMYVPEVLLSARAMQAGIDVLTPLWDAKGGRDLGKIVFGTVKGDIHNLGKNLVSIMLRGVGFEVIDIGENIVAEQFIARALEEQAKIIAMSALLTTTMGYMKTVIDEIGKNGLKGKFKTLVGGACVTQRFANEIGADSYAANAGEAVLKAKALIGVK